MSTTSPLDATLSWDAQRFVPVFAFRVRMRRYFVKKDKEGNPIASAEAMKLWKTDEGRVSHELMFNSSTHHRYTQPPTSPGLR